MDLRNLWISINKRRDKKEHQKRVNGECERLKSQYNIWARKTNERGTNEVRHIRESSL